MSLLTAILSLVKPQSTDGVDVLRTAISTNADALDTAVLTGDARLLTTALQAALAGTAGTPGSTNKFVTHDDIGAGVQAHDGDLDLIAALSTTSFGRSLLTVANAAALLAVGAWAAPTLGTNIGGTAQYRTEGVDVVRLKGTLTNTSGGVIGAGATLATLPSGARPAATSLYAPVNSGAAEATLTISTAGVVTFSSGTAAGGFVGLDGITFTTT